MFSSIFNFYQAIGNGKIKPDFIQHHNGAGFTIPAINLRILTYDSARIIFRIAKEKKIGSFIFEIARSEIGYTNQSPKEYAQNIANAARDENFNGPIFLQGDHYQINAKKYQENPDKEITNLEKLIADSIAAGFYNIDIDASTLVDLTKKDLKEQQAANARITAQLTKYIRKLEKNIVISVGGEIGHIGEKNSTINDFNTFMNLYLKEIGNIRGISKISIQTGSSHGGIVLPNGTLKNIEIDFEVIKNLGNLAREKYQLAGIVQHGASTLPHEMFHLFLINKTLEIHLATGFQNIVFDAMPTYLRDKIYTWVEESFENERAKQDSEKQFIYKNRKKALGIFKQEINNLTPAEKQPILKSLEQEFRFIFEKLNVFDTQEIVGKYY